MKLARTSEVVLMAVALVGALSGCSSSTSTADRNARLTVAPVTASQASDVEFLVRSCAARVMAVRMAESHRQAGLPDNGLTEVGVQADAQIYYKPVPGFGADVANLIDLAVQQMPVAYQDAGPDDTISLEQANALAAQYSGLDDRSCRTAAQARVESGSLAQASAAARTPPPAPSSVVTAAPSPSDTLEPSPSPSSGASTAPVGAPTRVGSGREVCSYAGGFQVYAGGTATCDFARDVAVAVAEAGGSAGTVEGGTPTTHQRFRVTCMAGKVGMVCRGRDNFVVYLQ